MISLIWFIGVIVAWFQLKYWNGKEMYNHLSAAETAIISLMSWLIYPLYLAVWLEDRLKS